MDPRPLSATDRYGAARSASARAGCGICVQECPCGAIEMIPEEI
jgi:Pyruvate/2-oxoacid:ferredoxin oxidoreductase delta subunit